MTIRTSPVRNTTFDQVGGFDGVTRAVVRLFERLAQDAELASLVPPGVGEEARWQVELLLTDALGGPMAYDGPDPLEIATRLGIDGPKARRLLDTLVAAFVETGVDRTLEASLRARCEAAAARHGVNLVPGPSSAPGGPRHGLIEGALARVREAGLERWNLFVLDPDLTVVHVSPEAARAAMACDAELRHAFNCGAADLPGSSILRFHPAPTQLQRVLADSSRLPAETTWSFGRAVWKARLLPVTGPGGHQLGWAVPWRDESEAHRIDAAFQRLRNQAEELPVPVMFPDATFERWFGNAACEHAMERLGPYLPRGISGLEGVPIELFFPDPAARQELFRSPERLPHKERIRIGPETIALLVTPVLDQDQRYLGPQITWEIVHFTRPEAQPTVESETALPSSPASPAQPARGNPPGELPSAARALRAEARGLEKVSADLATLIRFLDTIADQAEGQAHLEPAGATAGGQDALHQAEAAVAGAVVLVQRAVFEATTALTAEARTLAGGLGAELRDATGRTQARATALERFVSVASGLSEIRTVLAATAAELGPGAVRAPGQEST